MRNGTINIALRMSDVVTANLALALPLSLLACSPYSAHIVTTASAVAIVFLMISVPVVTPRLSHAYRYRQLHDHVPETASSAI